MSSAFDPNFEFNAPKFHDFTNPSEDENADSWFDRLPLAQEESSSLASDAQKLASCGLDQSAQNIPIAQMIGNEEMELSVATASNTKPVVSGGEDAPSLLCAGSVPSELRDTSNPNDVSLNPGISMPGDEGLDISKEVSSVMTSDSDLSQKITAKDSIVSGVSALSIETKENLQNRQSIAQMEFPATSANIRSKKAFADSSSTRSNANLTESILALAGFKQREHDVKQIADSTVAEIACNPAMQELASSVTEDPALESKPIASRTRSSTEGSLARQLPFVPKLIFPTSNESIDASTKQQSLARKSTVGGTGPAGNPRHSSVQLDSRRKSAAIISKATASKEQVPRSIKRSHAGVSVTPSQSKRARGMNGEHHARTPTFSRFATASSDASAARRCQSAPRTRPSAGFDKAMTTPRSSITTPRSSAEGLSCGSSSRSASRQDLTRPTMSSSRKASHRRESKDSVTAFKPTMQLTVPYSPQLATSARTKRRAQAEVAQEKSVSSVSSASKNFTPGRLTVPRSPRLSQRSSSRPRTADSDTLQLRQAEEALEQLKKRRKVGEERLRCVLEPRGEVANSMRSTKELTVPVSPILHTATRPTTRLASASTDSLDQDLEGGKSEPYIPLAERLMKYNEKGPRGNAFSGEASHPESHSKPKLTEPKTPEFSSFRRKEQKIKGFSQIETEQLEEIKKYQFKARPLNKRVLESCGDLGVPRIEKKPLTNPREPQLRVNERAEVHRSRDSSMDSISEVSFEFKAKPTPKAVREPPKPAVVHQHKALTVPESPTLATKVRSSQRASYLEEPTIPVFKAAPMPDFSKSTYLPRHDNLVLTEPSPFKLSTEERHKQHEEERKRRIEAQRQSEEEARKYKANPIRTFSESNTRSSGSFHAKPLTETQPFNLQSEARHEHSKFLWEQQVEKELQQEREKFSSFQARSVPKIVTSREEVFTPRRSSRALTEVDQFELNVDRRSRERELFEQSKLNRELKIVDERRHDEERRKEGEERELREMRKTMTVRARPVPNSVYTANFDVQRSTKPLTEPQSPHLRTSMRLRSFAAD